VPTPRTLATVRAVAAFLEAVVGCAGHVDTAVAAGR
jgi:hypothetical protein